MCLFSNFLKNCSLEGCQQCKNSSVIIFFTHLSELFSKIKSILQKFQVIWITFAKVRESKPLKMNKNIQKPFILILLPPEMPQDILKSLWVKVQLCYVLKPVERDLKKVYFAAFTIYGFISFQLI